MKRALFLPLFDELSHPTQVAALASEAEAAGWDGLFVWDHVAYRPGRGDRQPVDHAGGGRVCDVHAADRPDGDLAGPAPPAVGGT